MSVISYLENRASSAVLSSAEKLLIDSSLATLQQRLGEHFGEDIKQQFRFGSSTRDTILPRRMDERSDIDYMVVFNRGAQTSQAYLDRLKRFVEKYYSRSEVYQSSPTITLELNHIKFEIVPALSNWFTGYQIPKSTGGWRDTDPNGFNDDLTSTNKDHNSLIKPTIRLAKYWNAQNGYPFGSFEFEKWICNRWFWFCKNQRDYLFYVFNALSEEVETELKTKQAIVRAQKIVQQVRKYEKESLMAEAEKEVEKLIPA